MKKIKEDPILKIIEKSGNGFHLKVKDYLESLGWEVCVSQFYSDPVTDKPREIDILAKKKFPISDSGKNICVRLFIECKYVSEDNVVWFLDKDQQKAKSLVLNNHIMRGSKDNQLSIVREHQFIPHHYLKPNPVAKLTGRINNNGDIFYDGMNGCLHSLISLENQDYESYRLDYPIIVLNAFDKIYRATGDTINQYSKIEDNFQLAVDYSYIKNTRQVNQYFLIDIVSFDLLNNFLSELKEVDIAIAEGIVLDQIRERRFQEMFGENNNNNFDPYSPI